MAIGKDVVNELGVVSKYHNISKIKFDYLIDNINVEILNYFDESYRNQEKDDYNNNEEQINRFYELKKLQEDDDITNLETQELSSMSIQELEARKNIQTFIGRENYYLEDTGMDFRENLYKQIMDEIPLLKDSEAV